MAKVRTLPLRVYALGAISAALIGCPNQDAPGELVGKYAVSGALQENTCGSEALPAEAALKFNLEVRRTDSQGYWIYNGPPGVSGNLADDGSFLFEYANSYDAPNTAVVVPEQNADFVDLQPDTPTQTSNCRLQVIERIKGSLVLQESDGGLVSADDADGASTLTADDTIEISAAAGTDCSAVRADHGGPFIALPCAAHYTLTAATR
jgi:hypothetical protein